MNRQWIRLQLPRDDPASAPVRRLAVRRLEPGRPAAVELFSYDPGLDDAFPVDRNPVIQGTGPVVFVAVLFRRSDIDHAFFSRYWREDHVRFGHLIPHARSYIQMHADPAAPFDGICEVAFDSIDDLIAGLNAPVIAVEARRDEEEFVDHQRAYGMVCLESAGVSPSRR